MCIAVLVCAVFIICSALAAKPGSIDKQEWRYDTYCTSDPNRMTVLGELREETVADCDQVACTAIGEGRKVCACLRGREKEFRIMDNGGALQVWHEDEPSYPYLEPAFQAFRADLAGNGRSELVIIDYGGSTNGMVVSFFTVFILAVADLSKPPLQFMVEDTGVQDMFLVGGEGGPCRILDTTGSTVRTGMVRAGCILSADGSYIETGLFFPTGRIR